jgi:glycosyltransferase involved in cell wall biosynthesis
MKILISHPTGNTNVRAIVKGFFYRGLLYQFHTSLAVFPDNLWYKIGGLKGLSDFRRRSFDSELEPFTKAYPFRELGKAFANKIGFRYLTKHEKGRFSTDQIYKTLDKQVSKRLKNAKMKGATAVYAYEDGALETFVEAKKLGLKCIYDLPIAYHETLHKLLLDEVKRKPDWAETLGGGIKDSREKLTRKRKELELADAIVVASDFVRDSLPQWALNKKIILSPFGTPSKNTFIQAEKSTNKKLRVLFVGSMTQRKGLCDLFEAINLVDKNKVELVVLGSLAAPISFYEEQTSFTYEKTRPHKGVLELMQSCDVFCLPSLVEGRALVMQEAMSQGLPIIITPNTGGKDLVIDGETGFLVPIKNPLAIANKINWFVDNKSKIPFMSTQAKKHAAGYTWEKYSDTIIAELSVYLE